MSGVRSVKEAVAGREEAVLAALGIRVTREHQRCPFPDHEDRRPSWRWDGSCARWFCTCGSGDIFEVVERLRGDDFRGASAYIAGILALFGRDARAQRPRHAKLQQRQGAPAQRQTLDPWWRAFFDDCRPIEPGSVPACYLKHRGCALPPLDGDLRWVAAHRHPCGYAGPALVALVTDAVTGEPLTLHRTWLRPDGLGKAAIDRPRLLLKGHQKRGGVVRLWPDTEVTIGLCMAEGIETALAAARAFGSAWATIDAGNLAVFPVLEGLEAVTIVADHDRAGLDAARKCAARWSATGREVRIWQAEEENTDFADIASGGGA
jgi:putative DNA primase/helicase